MSVGLRKTYTFLSSSSLWAERRGCMLAIDSRQRNLRDLQNVVGADGLPSML
jgi:hypothetical protein